MDCDFELFDCDNHYYEALDAFTRHIEPEYRRRGVQWATVDGKTRLLVGGRVNRYIPNPTFDPVTRPGALDEYFRGKNEEGKEMRSLFGQLEPLADHPEYVNRDARLSVMDRQGIQGAFLLPTLGVGIEQALRDDPPALVAAFRAFNRWLQEDWGFAYKERIFAAAVMTFADPATLVAEAQWCLDNDARFLVIVPGPIITRSGGVSPADPIFDPFWDLVNASGVTVALHGGETHYTNYLDDWGDNVGAEAFRQNAFRYLISPSPIRDYIANLLARGLFERFPNLRLASIENGSDWVNHLMPRLKKSFAQTPQLWKEDPRETFKRHFWISPYYEEKIARLCDLIGVNRVVMGSDFPHAEGLADPRTYLDDLTRQGLSGTDARLIMRDTGLELATRRPT